MNQAHSQELESYQWKNRLLVILSPTQNDSLAAQQLELFTDTPQELSERKLLLIQVTPDSLKTFDDDVQAASATTTESWWKRLGNKNNRFEVLLIGLDGDIKARFKEPVSAQHIFDRIDSMPMRRSALDKK
jgi:hypothetical protein